MEDKEVKVRKVKKTVRQPKTTFVEMTRSDGLVANVHPNNVEKFKAQGYK